MTHSAKLGLHLDTPTRSRLRDLQIGKYKRASEESSSWNSGCLGRASFHLARLFLSGDRILQISRAFWTLLAFMCLHLTLARPMCSLRCALACIGDTMLYQVFRSFLPRKIYLPPSLPVLVSQDASGGFRKEAREDT